MIQLNNTIYVCNVTRYLNASSRWILIIVRRVFF